ncbi:MAG: hypothetical protein KIPDCIKN_03589 [Haliscomenobacter sp.]|nr:hypothetical protein [Haliscomenobacter sp.]
MQVFTVGDFKSHFSELLERVRKGEKIAIAFGRKKEVVAILTPPPKSPGLARPLGILEGKAQVVFSEDFNITEEAFLNA